MEIDVLGIPTDFGANRRGVDMGPSAIRYAGLIAELNKLDIIVNDLGDIRVPMVRNEALIDNKGAKFLDEVVNVCQVLAQQIENSINKGNVPITIGGDHSITLGSLAGLSKHQEVGLIWFDAHGDFNTGMTSESGNIHGMPLASLVGRGLKQLTDFYGFSPKVKEKNVVLVGVRDLDQGEKELLQSSEVSLFTMDDIDRMGIYEVMQQAIKISTSSVSKVHVSFDIDVLDPLEAPGVGTPVNGGLNYREAHLALEMIAERNILAALDLVEVNPILDERNKTAQLAVEFIASVLGKRIL